MKLGREIARFEARTDGGSHPSERVNSISLRDCGQTLDRTYNPNTPKVTNSWRRVRPWSAKFSNIEEARADYLKRSYVKLPILSSAKRLVKVL